jgi:hypothetical protein
VPSYSFPITTETAKALEQYGPLLPVTLTVPVLRKQYLASLGLTADRSKQGFALIDTGAALSAVDDRVMSELEIPVLNQMETATPHGTGLSNMYNASASFHDLAMLDVHLDDVLGCYLGDFEEGRPEIIMLLGRDILRNLVLTYDGPNDRVTIHT